MSLSGTLRAESKSPAGATGPDWAIDIPLGMSLLLLPWARSLVTVCWIVLVGVAAWRASRRELRLPREILLGAACYIITWGVSILGSRDPATSLTDWLARMAFLLPLLAILGRREGRPMHPIVRWAWVAGVELVGLWLLGEMVTGRRWLSGTISPGLSYPMIPNPNAAAQFTLVLFAWTFGLALDPLERMPRVWRVAVWVVPVALLAAGGSRASWVGFAAVTGILSWRRRRPIMGLAALGMFAACNALFPRMLWSRAVQLGDVSDISILGRLQGWETALRMMAERVFTGEGLGTWKLVYSQMRLPSYPAAADWPHAHSFYFNTLAETGVLGLAGFIAWIVAFRKLWRAGLFEPGSAGETQAMAAALAGLALVGLFDITFWGEPGYAFLALACLAWRGRASLTLRKAG